MIVVNSLSLSLPPAHLVNSQPCRVSPRCFCPLCFQTVLAGECCDDKLLENFSSWSPLLLVSQLSMYGWVISYHSQASPPLLTNTYQAPTRCQEQTISGWAHHLHSLEVSTQHAEMDSSTVMCTYHYSPVLSYSLSIPAFLYKRSFLTERSSFLSKVEISGHLLLPLPQPYVISYGLFISSLRFSPLGSFPQPTNI